MIFTREFDIFHASVLDANGIGTISKKEYTYSGCLFDCKLNKMAHLNRIIGSLNRMVSIFLTYFASVEIGLKVKLLRILSLWGQIVHDQRGCSIFVRKLAVSYQ